MSRFCLVSPQNPLAIVLILSLCNTGLSLRCYSCTNGPASKDIEGLEDSNELRYSHHSKCQEGDLPTSLSTDCESLPFSSLFHVNNDTALNRQVGSDYACIKIKHRLLKDVAYEKRCTYISNERYEKYKDGWVMQYSEFTSEIGYLCKGDNCNAATKFHGGVVMVIIPVMITAFLTGLFK